MLLNFAALSSDRRRAQSMTRIGHVAELYIVIFVPPRELGTSQNPIIDRHERLYYDTSGYGTAIGRVNAPPTNAFQRS